MKQKGLLLLFLTCLTVFSFGQTKVKFYTTLGDFEVLLYDSIVPITAGNFIDLVEKKYYDGVIFHRVINNFMIQGGDPTGTGSGGPGYTIDDEFNSTLSNVQKTISMANSGPNTGGSQFFINLVDNSYLDYNKAPLSSKHAVFGIVDDSFEVVQRIGRTPTNISNRPRTEVIMDSIRVLRSEFLVDNKFVVAPNPLTLNSVVAYIPSCSTGASTNSTVKITCVNQQGQLVWFKNVTLPCAIQANISLADLHQNNLPLGIYYLHVNDGQQCVTARIAVF